MSLPRILPNRQDVLAYEFRTTLEGVEFKFRFWFNQRDSSWYVDLYDVNEVLLCAGTRVALGHLPLGWTYDDRFPSGVFTVIDTETDDVEATETDLGTRVLILFFGTTP